MAAKTKINIIIHSFALAHAITAFVLNYIGTRDDILLTILTIAMIITIARMYDFPIDVTSALALLGCFAGFYMGTKGADIISGILGGQIATNSTDLAITLAENTKTIGGKLIPYANIITTFIVTEFLGWMVFLIVRRNKKNKR